MKYKCIKQLRLERNGEHFLGKPITVEIGSIWKDNNRSISHGGICLEKCDPIRCQWIEISEEDFSKCFAG